MIINKSKYASKYPGAYYALANEKSDMEIRSGFGDDIVHLEEYYGREWITGKGYVDKPVDWTALAHYMSAAEDLRQWQCMYDYNNADGFYFKEIFSVGKECIYADGYSQIPDLFYPEGIDGQCFMDDYFINLIIADEDGGIICRINRKNYNVKFYAIGEDDGYWFIVREHWIKDIRCWKNRLMSEVSELHIPDFDHQKVIEKIWNSNLEPETKYRH